MVHKKTNLDWDDIRYFLAVSRTSSIRRAALELGVNHATVSRRIGQFEKQLGVRLFEKLPTGYVITSAGEEISSLAEHMEGQANALERKVYGRDMGLTGKLRVTLPQILATHLIMPDLVQFAHENSGIELDIVTSYEVLNLTKRQADVAIRLIYKSQDLPDNLYGRKLVNVHRAVYASAKLMNQRQHETIPSAFNWIAKEEDGALPDWAARSFVPAKGSTYLVSDLHTQLAATQNGLGASILHCYIGDQDPGLQRLALKHTEHYGELWILTHGDIRNTPRVRAFTDFITDAIHAHTSLLEGTNYK